MVTQNLGVDVEFVVKQFLEVPDSQLGRIHRLLSHVEDHILPVFEGAAHLSY